jgi:hypothetical protein
MLLGEHAMDLASVFDRFEQDSIYAAEQTDEARKRDHMWPGPTVWRTGTKEKPRRRWGQGRAFNGRFASEAGAAFLWTDEVSKSNATNKALPLRLGPCRSMSNMASPFRPGDDLAIDGDGRHGSTKPIPAEAQTLEQHATNVGAAATISSAPAGTFLRCRAFFLAFLRRWCNGQAAWQNQGK